MYKKAVKRQGHLVLLVVNMYVPRLQPQLTRFLQGTVKNNQQLINHMHSVCDSVRT